jgi:7-cyano-7-deazaguanine synthase
MPEDQPSVSHSVRQTGNSKKKAVLIYSGGMDSTVLLYQLVQQYEVYAISINYGQRHAKELARAAMFCDILNVPHKVVDLTCLQEVLGGSCLTDPAIEVPEGHYAEESMKATVVPNRNMIMLSVAAGYAMSLKADFLAYAAHAGDHHIYPDCRPEFAQSMQHAIGLADFHKVRFLRPFIALTKTDIAKRGYLLSVPFEQTWSCYKGLEKHCGKCGTCVERQEALRDAGLMDKTEYEQ